MYAMLVSYSINKAEIDENIGRLSELDGDDQMDTKWDLVHNVDIIVKIFDKNREVVKKLEL